MPEPTAPAAPAAPSAGGGDTPPTATPPADPKNPPAAPAAPAEPSQVILTDEQLAAAFQHPRFKELTQQAQRAKELDKQIKEAEEKKLQDEKKWEELAAKRSDEISTLRSSMINAEIRAEAARLGAVNPQIVANSLNLDGVDVDDNGNLTGVKEALEALKESDPYLFNSSNNNNNQTKRVGSPTNPGGNNTGYKFTMSQIKDQKFYQEHRKEIGEALRMGQVDKDN